MTSVIDDILTIQEFHVLGIKKDTNDAYKGDVLKAIFQDGPYLSSGLVIEERVKVFIDKLLDQVSAFC